MFDTRRLERAVVQAAPFLVTALVLGVYVLFSGGGEPFFRGDETRHVMTGVFFRDLFIDLPRSDFRTDLRDYAVRYYVQYPAVSLLVWPPLFYVLEGMCFLIFGISYLVSKGLVIAFAGAACLYTYHLVKRTHGATMAAWTVLFFGLSPVVLKHSRQVMLEVPTLALGMAASFHFLSYLDLERRRDIVLAAMASTGAALIRYDVLYLLLFFASGLLVSGKLKLLLRKEVILSASAALLVVAPVYALTVYEVGWSKLYVGAAQAGGAPERSGFLAPANFLYYPLELPGSLGWFALVPAVAGMASSLSGERLKRSWPYFCLAAAVYLTFSPIGKLATRHGIYLIPAMALFASQGISLLCERLPGRPGVAGWAIALPLIAGTAWMASPEPVPHLRGYEAAALLVIEESRLSRICLFDGGLDGNFIFQMRLHDPHRRSWTLRGDKVLYEVLVTPEHGYREYASSDEEILAVISDHNPELIVVEEPRVFFDTPVARRLREVLKKTPGRFKPEAAFPVESSDPRLRVRLLVYRNLEARPQPPKTIELRMLRLRRGLKANLAD